MHVKLIKLNAYSFTNHRKYTFQKETNHFSLTSHWISIDIKYPQWFKNTILYFKRTVD